MTRSILHVGAWGRNWGDHAIRYCMVRDLTEAFRAKNIEPEWTHVDIQATDFEGFDFSPYDLVIVGGGGLLWDKPELESYTGWQWRIPANELLAIEAPLVLYGLGYTKFPYTDPTGSLNALTPLWSHLRIATSHAALTSVRNRETGDLLRHHGISDFACIPDPAVALGRCIPPEVRNGRRTVGLCWASDKPQWRFGSVGRYEHYLDMLARTLARTLLANDRVVMVEHIAGMDSDAAEVFREHLQDRFSFVRAGTPTTDGVPEFFAAYDQCHVVLSARKHGVWIPAGKRIGVLGFGSVKEVEWTVSSVTMGSFNHINPIDLEVWPAQSRLKIDHALQVEDGYDRMLAPLERSLAQFNAKIVGLVT